MPRDLDSLAGELRRLTPADRKAVLDKVAAFESLTQSVTTDPDVDLVYQSLMDFCRSRGLSLAPQSVLCKLRRSGPALRKNTPVVLRLVREDLGLTKTLDVRRGVDCVLQIVERRMKEQRIPIRPETVILLLKHAPAYVDRGFPGYRQSGLLPMVGQRMVRGDE